MKVIHFSQVKAAFEPADIPRERIIEGQPQAKVQSLFDSADGRISVGTWVCTPGRWRVRYDETEYCQILSGTGAIIGQDGTTHTIRAGDEFVVAAGFEGEWLVEDSMRKRYVVFQP